MPMSAIQLYMQRLQKHQASMRLMWGEAATVPHLELDARREWARNLEEILDDGSKPAQPTPPAVLKMAGIGVEFVRPPER